MAIEFSFDPPKAASNQAKHGVTFGEASTVFGDGFALRVPDPDHSEQENRFILLGVSEKRRLPVVVYAATGLNRIRIISTRKASGSEKKTYNDRLGGFQRGKR